MGLAAAAEGRWPDAVAHFRRSLAHAERPAARFNLLVALDHVGEHEALVAAADRFLALTTDARYRPQRATARALRASAIEALGATGRQAPNASIVGDTSSAPVERDASSEDIESGARGHSSERIESGHLTPDGIESRTPSAGPIDRADGRSSRGIERRSLGDDSADPAGLDGADPGDRSPDDRAGLDGADPRDRGAAPDDRAGLEDGADPRLRSVVDRAGIGEGVPTRPTHLRRTLGLASLSFGLASAAAGWAVAATAATRARSLSAADATQAGFLSASTRYRRLRAASHHLALSSAVALGVGCLLHALPPLSRPLRWVLGVRGAALSRGGAALLARRPRGLSDTTLTAPTRAFGSLLLAAGVPLALAPIVSPSAESSRVSVGLGFTVALR